MRHEDISAIFSRAQTLMGSHIEIPFEPGYRLHHGRRVANLAVRIGAQLGFEFDEDIIVVAGTLHDIGKTVNDGHDESHGPIGAKIIAAEFKDRLSEEELRQVCNIVENHYARPKSSWYEGKEKPEFSNNVYLIQDADVLDHFGYEGIWIALHWASYKNLTPEQSAKSWRESEYAVNKRRESMKSLNFDYSRRLLEERIAIMQTFFDSLE